MQTQVCKYAHIQLYDFISSTASIHIRTLVHTQVTTYIIKELHTNIVICLHPLAGTKKCRYIRPYSKVERIGVHWHYLALQHSSMLYWRGVYFVKWFLLTDLCKNIMKYQVRKWTARSRFSLLYLIRPEGRIFVFTRTRQVVFWGTRNEFRASKQLALAGA